MSSKVLAWESDRQYVSVCVCKSVFYSVFFPPVVISLSLYKVRVTCKHTISWHLALISIYSILYKIGPYNAMYCQVRGDHKQVSFLPSVEDAF